MEAAKLFFVLVWLPLPFTKCAESRKRLHYFAHRDNMAIQTFFSRFVGSISDQCLQCICMVESSCQPVGCVMDMGSLSCGYYQIKQPYYEDCGSPGTDDIVARGEVALRNKVSDKQCSQGWQACADDYSCATTCVRNYMARYGPISGCPDTCETYARIHNGGPQGCNNPNTIPYWHRVQSFGC